MKPQRIHLRRTKGFNLQAVSMALNGLPAVKVTRPSRWGNPFKVGRDGTAAECVAQYRHEMNVRAPIDWHQTWLKKLRGKNLACFCPLAQPCHADVLLEIANAGDGGNG